MKLQLQHMDRKVDKLANPNANVAGPSQDHPKQWSLLQRFSSVRHFSLFLVCSLGGHEAIQVYFLFWEGRKLLGWITIGFHGI